MEATHFKKCSSPDDSVDYGLVACSSGDKEAIRMDLMQVEGPRLVAPLVTFKDFVKVLGTAKSSVSEKDIERHTEWTSEFGQEG